MAKLLLVDDDEKLVSVIEEVLTAEKYVVDKVFNGADAKAYFEAVNYDLIILDWNLPDTIGLDLCLDYRRSGGTAPVLFLTGEDKIDYKVSGLDAGADDYLTKPFANAELLSRVRALLRRPHAVRPQVIAVRDLQLEPLTHTISRAGVELKLYPKEFSLLELFMLHPNQIFSVDDLLDRVWKTDAEAAVETVRQTILRLRQKIEVAGQEPLIQTVRGVGYRLQP